MTRSAPRWWPALALLLTACTGTPDVPVPTSLTLQPVGTLRVGESLTLGAEVRDQWGQVMALPVTWTSSQPQLAAVQGNTVAASRLTPTNQPLTLTASVGALQATTALTTTGLEVTLGTYALSGQATLGTAAFVRFRPGAGSAVPDSTVTITAPDGQAVLTDLVRLSSADEVSSGWAYSAQTPPQSGVYRAALDSSGVRYRAADEVDAASKAPFAASASVTIQPDRTYEIQANLTGQPVVLATAFGEGVRFFGQATANELPKRGTISLAPGTYSTGVFTLPLKLGAVPFTAPTPQTFNLTYQSTGSVTLP